MIGCNIRPGMTPGGFTSTREKGPRRYAGKSQGLYADAQKINDAATEFLRDRDVAGRPTAFDRTRHFPQKPECQPAPSPVPIVESQPPASSGPQPAADAAPVSDPGI